MNLFQELKHRNVFRGGPKKSDSSISKLSFVVRPHAQYFDDTLIDQDLVDQPVLNADSARVGTLKISD